MNNALRLILLSLYYITNIILHQESSHVDNKYKIRLKKIKTIYFVYLLQTMLLQGQSRQITQSYNLSSPWYRHYKDNYST